MFRRFRERNGYDLRPRLPDLFFDVSPDSARIRHDFYTTLTAFYADAYYRQIHDWCREHDVLFTGHLLYEEWLRSMVRVEGNPFRHYPHMDVIGVDHLYPIIGSRDRPAEHVAMKLGSLSRPPARERAASLRVVRRHLHGRHDAADEVDYRLGVRPRRQPAQPARLPLHPGRPAQAGLAAVDVLPVPLVARL